VRLVRGSKGHAVPPLAGERSLPIADVRAFLQQASRDDDPKLTVAIEAPEGHLVGCAGLRNIIAGESAEVSLVIGEPEAWGRGYGQEAMTLLLRFAFESLKLTRVWLLVRADNLRGVRLFTRLGFVITETLERAVVAQGLPRDKYRMALTPEAWRATTHGP
jgi:RimJ/RimL family protein N-acetyltransferase